MKTPNLPTRMQRRLNRIQPAGLLRKASRGRLKRSRSHRSRVGGSLPDRTREAVDRLAGRGR